VVGVVDSGLQRLRMLGLHRLAEPERVALAELADDRPALD
jgi:hypothetical protein